MPHISRFFRCFGCSHRHRLPLISVGAIGGHGDFSQRKAVEQRKNDGGSPHSHRRARSGRHDQARLRKGGRKVRTMMHAVVVGVTVVVGVLPSL